MGENIDPQLQEELGITPETLEQWEDELDQFAVEIVARLERVAGPDAPQSMPNVLPVRKGFS